MSKCNGEERHTHYQLSTGELFYHTHSHTAILDSAGLAKDFNRLHHHAPLEHENFTTEQLEKDAEYLEVPF